MPKMIHQIENFQNFLPFAQTEDCFVVRNHHLSEQLYIEESRNS